MFLITTFNPVINPTGTFNTTFPEGFGRIVVRNLTPVGIQLGISINSDWTPNLIPGESRLFIIDKPSAIISWKLSSPLASFYTLNYNVVVEGYGANERVEEVYPAYAPPNFFQNNIIGGPPIMRVHTLSSNGNDGPFNIGPTGGILSTQSVWIKGADISTFKTPGATDTKVQASFGNIDYTDNASNLFLDWNILKTSTAVQYFSLPFSWRPPADLKSFTGTLPTIQTISSANLTVDYLIYYYVQ